MKGDIAFAGFMLTAEEWKALDAETRHQLVAVATRKFPTGTEPPYMQGRKAVIAGGTIVEEPVGPLAEGSGPQQIDEYIELFGDD